LVLFSLAGGLLLALALSLQHRQPKPVVQVQAVTTPPPPKVTVPSAAPVAPAQPPDVGTDKLRLAYDDLRKESDARMIRQKLADLRRELAAMPTNAAVADVRKFLDSKTDAATRLGFKLASNGSLDEAPTFRTFLLDELARLDPAAAADYSKIILSSMDSSDEWAVALRNLAAGDPSAEGRELLEQKTAQMLQNSSWQQNPSVGYLEAFDVPVYLGGTDFVPTLTGLVQTQDNPAISHAAYLSLDRLVINNTADVLAALEADPGLMQGRESTRADYFARADVRDPQQQQILESYLLNPAISAAELNTFAGVFPNANYMISPNLLTTATTPNHDALTSLDAQSLAVAQAWLADPRFSQVAPELQTVIQRLEGFAAQARQGR
jgi:hypothetical protein